MPVNFVSDSDFREIAQSGQPSPEGLRKEFIAEVTADVIESRILTFAISTESIDRSGDVVAVAGWDTANYRKNPVILWAHSYHSLPLGKSLHEWSEEGKLKSRAEFTPAGMLRFNDVVYEMYKKHFLSAVSVGFSPKKWAWAEDEHRKRGIDFMEQELLEYSAVPVPANAEALIEARSAGIDVSVLRDWAVQTLSALHIQTDKHLSLAVDSRAIADAVIEHMKLAMEATAVVAAVEKAPAHPACTEVLKLRLRRLALR